MSGTEIVPAFNQGNHPSPYAPFRRELLITAFNDAATAHPDGRRVSYTLGRAMMCCGKILKVINVAEPEQERDVAEGWNEIIMPLSC